MLSRIGPIEMFLYFGMTANLQNGITLDCFDIRDAKDNTVHNRMAMTILHNIACALEDSKQNGKMFTLVRHPNDYHVECDSVRGINSCIKIIRSEVQKIAAAFDKCRHDVKKITDSYGYETVKHALTKTNA
jgi:hypothetical protein